ncbi:SHOCT domain-containing protein [Millisia brevis]|uniref:SHOCT domain-containing protein n=1 Tax=Millisia brevis TaxID=264148 RepID=UPI000836A8AC|nr:SHOCT domain-containing protein [Millisia brevis]
MPSAISPEGRRALDEIATRYGISVEAATAMLAAVVAGQGRMAQFNIPELGGSGQWMRGGMTMVGNMFDNALKARVDGLCNELAGLVDTPGTFVAAPTGGSTPAPAASRPAMSGFPAFAPMGNWWPEDLGTPSSSGGQNDTRYAVFPATGRLAISANGVVTIYDTGDHRVTGVQQQQGGRPGTLTFTSQLGTFDVSSLRPVGETSAPAGEPVSERGPAPAAPASATPPPPPAAGPTPASPAAGPAPAAVPPPVAPTIEGSADILAAIEKLADLHSRGILTDTEFAAKKADLLGRL